MNPPLLARTSQPDRQDRSHCRVEDDREIHPCPMCGVDVERYLYAPGRSRVYCTNACRQRAYRWRRANGVRLCVDRTGPTVRMINQKSHALRDSRDPVGDVRDRRRRQVAVCGAYAGAVYPDHVSHTNFVPDHPFSCERCADLVGASEPYHGIPERLMGIVTFPPRSERDRAAPVGWRQWSIN
ncbi:hypothetical protein BDK89_3289 [Ilumatobacter fluminis]|uniref:Uncharacterized protein n=1 Tax=Ilumatobacter fluminis TaxID=467091 RepID=A0A4V3EJM5_9ACTN|nr:hypothetical protein [Ilumatobacter fluminis]TDT17678.1 hypothetical protein BDK89_3289 [Ilumatobacter fluminis]